MNHRSPLIGLLAFGTLLLVTTVSHAQMEAGLLGKRYVAANVFIEDIRNEPIDNGSGAELSGNLPVTSFLDVGARISNETFDTADIKDRRFGAFVTGYMDMDEYKPYVEVALTNTRQRSTFGNVTYKNSENIYSVALGLEAPVTKNSALFAQAGYNAYFDSKLDEYWTYKVGFSSWLRPKLALIVSVSFFEGDSITWSAGLGLRF